MNKTQQWQLKQKLDREIHEYNVNGIQAIGASLMLSWQREGKPQTKDDFNESFKHTYIYLTGLIQRLWEILILKKV